MSQFFNTQGITKISMIIKTKNFCPLGDQDYTNIFNVDFVPDVTIPDYLDIQKQVDEQIADKELIIEDAVQVLFNIIKGYGPKAIRVTSVVENAAHFPVMVQREEGTF